MHNIKNLKRLDELNMKPQIDYPCMWSYRIIGLSVDDILSAIKNVFGDAFDRQGGVMPKEHYSKNHKYVSMNYTINVKSDEERVWFFEGLVRQSGIVMVF